MLSDSSSADSASLTASGSTPSAASVRVAPSASFARAPRSRCSTSIRRLRRRRASRAGPPVTPVVRSRAAPGEQLTSRCRAFHVRPGARERRAGVPQYGGGRKVGGAQDGDKDMLAARRVGSDRRCLLARVAQDAPRLVCRQQRWLVADQVAAPPVDACRDTPRSRAIVAKLSHPRAPAPPEAVRTSRVPSELADLPQRFAGRGRVDGLDGELRHPLTRPRRVHDRCGHSRRAAGTLFVVNNAAPGRRLDRAVSTLAEIDLVSTRVAPKKCLSLNIDLDCGRSIALDHHRASSHLRDRHCSPEIPVWTRDRPSAA